MVGTFVASDAVAVVVLVLFAATAFAEHHSKQLAQYLGTAAWGVFAFFWLNLVEHFAFTQLSAIEGVLSALAVPLSLYVAYLTYTDKKQFSHLTRAITIMGLIYFPFVAYTPAKQFLIETVTLQSEFLLSILGYNPPVILGDEGFRNTFEFITNDHRYLMHVVLACTGLGSISIISGLIGASRAPLRKKATALVFAISVIWILNLFRVAFITLSHGEQWFRVGVDFFMWLGVSDPNSVSYLIGDRIIAQSMSVVALIALTLVLVRILPELERVLNEIIEPLFGTTIDFTALVDR